MLIVCTREGQLCNRLFHFAHIVSFALDNNERLWYPHIDEYGRFFRNLTSSRLEKYKLVIYSNSILRLSLRVLRWLLKKIPGTRFLRYSEAVEEVDLAIFKGDDRRLLFLSGWLFRDYVALRKHREFIKSIFEFDEQVVADCLEKTVQLRCDNGLLVGVHIRRGDYIDFENGRFFYSDEVYKDKIDQLRKLFLDLGRNAYFIICTNDNSVHSSELLSDVDIMHNRGSDMSDLCMLSRCDYIIGPPSTYSGWASFYGSVPLAYITEANQIMKRSDFAVIDD